MSIDFDEAEMCKGEKCTNFLMTKKETERGLCPMCFEEDRQEE